MWRLYQLRKRWVTLRLIIRFGGTECAYCNCTFTPTGSRQRTIDHLTPLSKGGTWRVSNLIFACASCNRKKNDHELALFLWSPWLKARREVVEAEKAKKLQNAA